MVFQIVISKYNINEVTKLFYLSNKFTLTTRNTRPETKRKRTINRTFSTPAIKNIKKTFDSDALILRTLCGTLFPKGVVPGRLTAAGRDNAATPAGRSRDPSLFRTDKVAEVLVISGKIPPAMILEDEDEGPKTIRRLKRRRWYPGRLQRVGLKSTLGNVPHLYLYIR